TIGTPLSRHRHTIRKAHPASQDTYPHPNGPRDPDGHLKETSHLQGSSTYHSIVWGTLFSQLLLRSVLVARECHMRPIVVPWSQPRASPERSYACAVRLWPATNRTDHGAGEVSDD